MTQRPMHPMMQRFFWPHLTPLRPSFQPRFHPGPPRPPQEIDYFAFGDFRQARVSETSSEAAPPEAVTESNTKSNIIPSSEVTQPSSSAYKLISVKKTSKN